MRVKYIGDEWCFLNAIAQVINLSPVPGSSQMLVMIDGDLVTVCRHDWKFEA